MGRTFIQIVQRQQIKKSEQRKQTIAVSIDAKQIYNIYSGCYKDHSINQQYDEYSRKGITAFGIFSKNTKIHHNDF